MRICEEIGMEKLGNPVVVDIQNVVDYMYEQQEDGNKTWNADDDFPSWVPPWPRTAYEYSLRDLSGRKQVDIMEIVVTDERGKDGFAMNALCVERTQNLLEIHGRVDFLAGPDGTSTGQDIGIATNQYILQNYESEDAYRTKVWGMVVPVLLANSFLACKNVTASDVAPHPKLAKAQLKKRGVPKVTYKVLDIGPAKEVLRTEGDIEHNGLQKALHICRGHFAHYGPDAPLFGKYTGAFWHPMHTRGSAKNGVVVKDYRVTGLPAPVQKS